VNTIEQKWRRWIADTPPGLVAGRVKVLDDLDAHRVHCRKGAVVSEWDGKWKAFCNMTVLEWRAQYLLAGMDGLIEDPIKDLVDQRIFKFTEGSIKERVSDEAVKRLGDQLFELLKPIVERLVETAINKPWLESLADLTEIPAGA